jgi:ABC-type antimicrobial peptide transport system permease subunit
VRNMVVFHGMRPALIGVGIGIVGAFGLTRLIASLLFGVRVYDPLIFIAVPIFLSAVALGAVCLAARRVSRIDPIEALRCE